MWSNVRVFSKEDVDGPWLDRVAIVIGGKRWSLDFSPFLNNNLKPWWHSCFRGYDEARGVRYWLFNIGWVVGVMISFSLLDEDKPTWPLTS